MNCGSGPLQIFGVEVRNYRNKVLDIIRGTDDLLQVDTDGPWHVADAPTPEGRTGACVGVPHRTGGDLQKGREGRWRYKPGGGL